MSARLFGKRLPPPEARCNPHAERSADAFSQLLIGLIMVQVLPAIPPQGEFLQSSLEFFPQCVSRVCSRGLGGCCLGLVPPLSSGVRRIGLDSLNRL